jgi:hypothetical protein
MTAKDVGSDLYQHIIAWSLANLNTYQHELTLKCWEDRPWMVSLYTGSCGEDRDYDIRTWCREQFGEEAWPLHGRWGRWYRGGATVYGWTHFGFSSRSMMEAAELAWPPPDDMPPTHKRAAP